MFGEGGHAGADVPRVRTPQLRVATGADDPEVAADAGLLVAGGDGRHRVVALGGERRAGQVVVVPAPPARNGGEPVPGRLRGCHPRSAGGCPPPPAPLFPVWLAAGLSKAGRPRRCTRPAGAPTARRPDPPDNPRPAPP